MAIEGEPSSLTTRYNNSIANKGPWDKRSLMDRGPGGVAVWKVPEALDFCL